VRIQTGIVVYASDHAVGVDAVRVGIGRSRSIDGRRGISDGLPLIAHGSLMSEVRSVFPKHRRPTLCVVRTGRPSDVLANSPVLRAETPVHTIRPRYHRIRRDSGDRELEVLRSMMAGSHLPAMPLSDKSAQSGSKPS